MPMWRAEEKSHRVYARFSILKKALLLLHGCQAVVLKVLFYKCIKSDGLSSYVTAAAWPMALYNCLLRHSRQSIHIRPPNASDVKHQTSRVDWRLADTRLLPGIRYRWQSAPYSWNACLVLLDRLIANISPDRFKTGRPRCRGHQLTANSSGDRGVLTVKGRIAQLVRVSGSLRTMHRSSVTQDNESDWQLVNECGAIAKWQRLHGTIP